MNLPPIDVSDANKVINLWQRKASAESEPQERLQLKKASGLYNSDGTKKCRHLNVLLDEEFTEVECEDCGAMLNPVKLLSKFMLAEGRGRAQLEQLNKQIAEAQDKLRCKCVHCNQMTPIVRKKAW